MKAQWLKRHEGKGDNQPSMKPGNEEEKADLFRRTCDDFQITGARNMADELQARRFVQNNDGYLPGMKFCRRRGYVLLEFEFDQ